ncbi:MAG: hypothetical protein LBJ72_03815, partial [Dysgonamonadaceae bacterium]|nr:hypothetical protein [Dysgonamonadaceae bacterium]
MTDKWNLNADRRYQCITPGFIWGKLNLLLILLSFFCLNTNAQKKTVTCVGASITAGGRIKIPSENSYPAQLQALLG